MRSLRDQLADVGLRWRLAGWVAVVVLLCLGIAFVAVYRGTGTQVRHQIDTEIAGDTSGFARSLALANPHSFRGAAQDATRYVHGQPFSSSSTLFFAFVAGAPTSTNVPELFQHEPPDQGETVAEQDQENRLAAHLLTVPDGYSTLPLPDVGSLRLLKRTVRLPGVPTPTHSVVLGVGEPLAPVASAQKGVARAFVLAGILALIGALLGAYLIGTRISRPLRRIAAVAARVDAGDLHPRIHRPNAQGHEIRVLADAFNHMLDRLTEAFAGQRAFVADASHELRTPLTVIRGQLEVLSAQENPPPEELRRVERLVQAEIARITRLVDDLLLLAKTEQAEFLRIKPIDLPAFVDELWHANTLLATRHFQLEEVPPGTLLADPDRLAQALRNLLANAIEHTTPEQGVVLMRVQRAGEDRIRFVVEDDGPGIPAEERERVFDRFHRTDEARDRASGGTGLGLAIVDAIAKAHGGSAEASASPAGGTRMKLELPGFTAAQPGMTPPQTQARPVSALSDDERAKIPH
ncbi:MAG TPA: HAMP domain-containing sensor histidine kinase [Solirubrobacteraceae bacterium]